MSKKKAISTSYANFGIKGALSHISGRLFGLPRYLKSASSIDFRHAKLAPTRTIEEFISKLVPSRSRLEITKAISKAKKIVDSLPAVKTSKLNAPERWNSGKDLQYILTTLVLLLKPDVVVETGTANGASAAATASGLKSNKKGKLISFDIADLNPVLLTKELRAWVKLIKTSGTPEDLINELQKITSKEKSIFLHDADHSYLGQYSDYEAAKEIGFEILISDDVDASLAFCDFAGGNGVVYYDAPKFIGGVRIKEL